MLLNGGCRPAQQRSNRGRIPLSLVFSGSIPAGSRLPRKLPCAHNHRREAGRKPNRNRYGPLRSFWKTAITAIPLPGNPCGIRATLRLARIFRAFLDKVIDPVKNVHTKDKLLRNISHFGSQPQAHRGGSKKPATGQMRKSSLRTKPLGHLEKFPFGFCESEASKSLERFSCHESGEIWVFRGAF